uniref:EEF1A lysine methyltransferase 1 n=1 Tax=Equus asinus TaxID=9793 RepID=A0A9L0K5J2_EQUAS
MSDSEDDDIPQLSSHTLAALQEFYAEQKQQIDPGGDDKYNIGIIGENWVSKRVPRLSGSSGVEPVLCLVQCSSASHLIPKSILPVIRELHLFGELGQKAVPEYFKTARVQIFLVLALKQQLSQFWYSQETALQLAKEAITAAGEGGRIACVSAPSVYQKLRELHREDFSVYIFEYDKRFAIYGEEFIFYDYNNPLDLPEKIAAHSFDIVIADPPYLSEECLRKTSETIKYLTQGKILLCTGAVMQEEAAKLLGVKMCKFIPEHTRTLANEFRCYVNYDSGLDHEI